ncbi:MAG TPA: D-alanyl-D-alanine carboxypeptidase family protein [Caldimonas sp.]|nr:D-alanyl-D-alanine carboxypeptidase family protein [Caldimonas sp.]HEX4234884.1 D-alanyl-D-alanine carboxypeptidase family protein [Caldimonas sp.]
MSLLRPFSRAFAATALVVFTGIAAAQALQPPEVAAKSYIVLDLTTHQTLAERNADAPADPASLTKLMTAYVAFQALRDKKLTLEQTLPVSRLAWAERKGGGSLMFIDTTMTPKVDELLKGVIVESGNDASVALAEGVAGSVDVFVNMMNRQAQAWGLKNTSFKNVTGLTQPGHTSTARDMATIAAHIISDFPEYFPYYSMKEYKYNNIAQPNRNLLLRRDPTVDGMKTGYTEAAGYCLLATAQREFPNLGPAGGAGKRRVMTVVLNTTSMEARANESQKLLNWGFQAFDTVRLFDDGKPIVTPQVWKGTASVAKLGSGGALYVSVPKGEGAKLQTRIERSDPLIAPLAKGQRVGKIVVTTASGAPVADVPLVVIEPVEQSGILGRAWDAIRLWIK